MSHRRASFIRLHLTDANAIGPGKANILEAIAKTGSIAAAARQMNMSYRRAWRLVKALNSRFRKPLVETTKGGQQGGGAKLTATGRVVLKLYREMESHAAGAIAEMVQEFRKLLVDRAHKE